MSRLAPRTGAVALCLALALLLLGALRLDAPPSASGQEDPFADAFYRPLAEDRPLGGPDAVLDAEADRFLPFGGESAPFEAPEGERQLSVSAPGGRWSDLATEGDRPISRLPARGIVGGAAELDAEERVMIAHCDCADGSTFLLDLESERWSAAPNDAELPYVNGLRAYDPEGDRFLLYGGDLKGLDLPTSQGWSYDMSEARSGWRELPAAPFTLTFTAHDVDPASGSVLAFGGQDEEGRATDGLWRLDLARADEAGAWVALSPHGDRPAPRMGATLTFAGESGMAVLFGGYTPETGQDFNDTWVLDHRDPEAPSWRRIEPAGAPASRSAHATAWDEERQDLVLYGGVAAGPGLIAYLEDAYVLDLAPEAPPTATPDGPTATPTPMETEEPADAIFLPLSLSDHSLP